MPIIRSLQTAVAASGLPFERSNGKPEADTAVYKLLMMVMRMAQTC